MTAGSAPGTTQNTNRSNRFTGGISSPVLGWVVLFIYIFGVCLSGLGFIHLFLGMFFDSFFVSPWLRVQLVAEGGHSVQPGTQC